MRLYHGSTFVVKEPNLELLKNKTDFGKGFYTTTNLEQAQKWVEIKKKRLLDQGYSKNIEKYINVYEYTENANLNILDFKEATEEWLKFVFMNRLSDELVHEFDIVKGPVANDNLYRVLLRYEDGVYTIEETIRRLKTYLLADQISFHTKNALDCLRYIETIKVEG